MRPDSISDKYTTVPVLAYGSLLLAIVLAGFGCRPSSMDFPRKPQYGNAVLEICCSDTAAEWPIGQACIGSRALYIGKFVHRVSWEFQRRNGDNDVYELLLEYSDSSGGRGLEKVTVEYSGSDVLVLDAHGVKCFMRPANEKEYGGNRSQSGRLLLVN